MLSVIIVDDEILVRVGLRTMLPWGDLGYRIVGDAENGVEGLKLLKGLQPDIVITDIKMPVMDGLEMMRRARAENSKSKFIVLSSYDDFHLVREALKMGAEDYLIKLELDQAGLVKVLQAVEKEITADVEQDRQKKADDIHAHLSMEAERKEFFMKLISGAISSPQEISESAGYLEIDGGERGIACCLVRIDGIVQEEKYARMEDRAMLEQQVENLIHEVAGDSHSVFGFRCGEGTFAIVVFGGKESVDSARMTGLEKMGGRIITTLRTYMNITATVGVSDIHAGLSALSGGFSEASTAADRSFFLGKGRVIRFRDAGAGLRTGSDLGTADHLRDLQTALDYSDAELLTRCFDAIRRSLEGDECTREQIYDFCFQLAYKLREIAETRHDLPLGELLNTAGLYRDITSLATLGSLLDWIGTLAEKSSDILMRNMEYGRHAITIRKVKRFVQDHLAADIRLAEAAEFLHINHCHLSTIFKHETGECFSDYVMKVKIEEAQKLLATGRYRIREAAEMLGYASAYYFSRVFKKVAGVTPSQYVQKKCSPEQKKDMPTPIGEKVSRGEGTA
jgi:two-component system response regulator YesN